MRYKILPFLAGLLVWAHPHALDAVKFPIISEPIFSEQEIKDAVEEVLAEEMTRSVKTDPTPIPAVLPPPAVARPLAFDNIVQKQTPAGSVVYLAPTTPNAGQYSLVQVLSQMSPNGYQPVITPLAKQFPATLNGQAVASLNLPGGTYANPLHDKKVEFLATQGDNVVAVKGKRVFVLQGGNPDALVSTADQTVHAPAPAAAAAVDLTPLKDAAGGNNNQPIAALATSPTDIFAAVSTAGQPFTADSLNRGVASLKLQGNVLVQNGNASPLRFTAIDGVAVARLTQARLNAVFAAAGVTNAVKAVMVAGALGSNAAAAQMTNLAAADIAGVSGVGLAAIGGAVANDIAPDPLAVAVGAALDGLAAPAAGTLLGNPAFTDAILKDPATATAITNAIDAAVLAGPALAARAPAAKAAAIAAAQGKTAVEVLGAVAQAQAAFNDGAAGAVARATFNRSPAAQKPGVVMHYSPELDRLFVGYRALRKDLLANPGGIMGIVVGEPDAAAPGGFKFSSLIHAPSPELFGVGGGGVNDQNLGNKIFAVHHGPALGNPAPAVNQFAQNQDPAITIQHLKTMRTSTGRDYLIVASSISNGGSSTKVLAGVYFIPLMGQKAFDANKTAAAAWQIGKVANAAGEALLSGAGVVLAGAAGAAPVRVLDAATSVANLPTHQANAIFDARNVGFTVPVVNVTKIVSIDAIKDLQVVGDSVILTIDGREAEWKGMFQSTALFDNDGKITRWSPLQRLGGTTQSEVKAARMDTASGNMMYVGGGVRGGNLFNVSDWLTNQIASRELQGLIAKHFPTSQGGVRGMYVFDKSTPSFNQTNNNRKMALMVVIGYDKVMVAQTMKQGIPVAHFYDRPVVRGGGDPATYTDGRTNLWQQNVFVFEDQGLKDIAPLTCAEVLRVRENAAANTGYIYVGGYKGVCRLQTPAGAGWETAVAGPPVVETGLISFADHRAGFGFTKINNPALKEVVKIVSTTGDPGVGKARLVVATNSKVFAVRNGNFELLPSVPGGRLLDELVLTREEAPVFDAVLLKNLTGVNDDSYLVLATAKGLKVVRVNGGFPGAAGDRFDVPLGTDTPIQLAYVAPQEGGVFGGVARGAAGGAGMLYVLAGDQARGDVKVYRFEARWDAAAQNVLTPIDNAVPLSVSMFRRYFATDGLKFMFGHDMGLDTGEMLNMSTLANPASSPLPLTWALGNEVGLGSFLSAPVRDSVTGAWMVPGSFGLKVND